MTNDPSWALAEHVCGTVMANLPDSARLAARQDILDTFGCLLGGSGAPGIAELAHVLTSAGGNPQSQVMLWQRRMPASQAAMMNASMAHALDFDDTLDHGGSIHPGASVLAASLAVADAIGGVTGEQFLLAVALGLDISCRVALASTVDRGWHRTAAMGVFGAAAAAGKLLNLSVEQMVNALGIAFSQAAGNRQCITDGALTKRLQAGQAASSGVFAATLAREGFTGAHNIFLGRYGFFELYQPNGYDAARLTDELGKKFRGEQLSFKPYPCGRPQHAMLDAAIAAREQLGIGTKADVSQIASLRVSTDAATRTDQFAGLATKRRPTHIVEAQFALPYLIAGAVVHGRLGIGEVAGIDNPIVLALAARMEADIVDDAGSALTLTLQNGQTTTVKLGKPLGSPENPLSIAQLRSKFTDCARNAVRPIAEADIVRVADAILALESATDIAAVFRAFG